MTTQFKAAIYARKSTESEDRQVLSIDSQIRELKEFAAKQSVTITTVLTESKSAKSPGRPVFDDLYRRVQKKEFDGIVCWKLDRLARNPIDGGALIWALDQGQLQKILTPSSIYSNSGSDKFLMQLEFGMAKKYVDDLSDNVRRGMRAKTESGWMPHLAPFGYLNDKAKKTIVKDPKRFPLVRRMWDLMLTGNYTPTQVAMVATEQWGLRSRTRHSRIGSGLSRSALYALFTNPFYYGLIVRAHETAAGKHTPMVTKAEYDRVQRLLGRNDRPRAKRLSFTYSGLLKCGYCGGSITAEEKRKRLKSTKATARYVYYRCSRYKAGIECREPAITETELERQFGQSLKSIQIPQQHALWMIQRMDELGVEELEKDKLARESVNNSIDRVRREISALLDLRLRGLVSDQEYADKKKKLEVELLTLESNKSDEAQSRVTSLVKRLVSFSAGAYDAFLNGDEKAKREIVSAVYSNCRLSARMLSIQAQKPLSILTLSNVGNGGDSPIFEPSIMGYGKGKSESLVPENPVWSGRLNDVRNWIRENQSEIEQSGLLIKLESTQKAITCQRRKELTARLPSA